MPLETPFTHHHRALGAKMVDFGGYWMPLQYQGQMVEHEKVRREVGLFDLSHMGEFEIRGEGAVEFANELITNDVAAKPAGGIVYSPMCRPDGGIVDDVLAYRREHGVLLVVNAANIAKDLAWIRDQAPEGVTIDDVSQETALLAVQGPKAEEALTPFIGEPLETLGYYQFMETVWDGMPVLISRTGYTGEDGFELFFDRKFADPLWERVTYAGSLLGMAPIGLAARDTLRLEVGYCLYGNDIDDGTTPLEAGLGWTVKFDKPDFLGKTALQAQKEAGAQKKLVGLTLDQPGAIARHGMNVVSAGESVGVVTSGTMSPTLRKAIAMAYVVKGLASAGSELQVDIRGRLAEARVCRLPFYSEGTRKK
jgi:aminomethyltransferase